MNKSTKIKDIFAFIEKANIIHNNKYSYTKSIYVGTYDKIIITCPIHGDFLQSPKYHLSGSGCKECSKTNRANTNKEKYGHENIAHGIYKDVITNTNLTKYGCKYPMQHETVQLKQQNTNQQRYGVKHISQSKIIKDKRISTNQQRYGVDFTFSSPIIQEQIKESFLLKYGGHPTKLPEVQQKRIQTCLERYNVDNVNKSNDIINKKKQTCITKYNVPNVNQQHMSQIWYLINDYNWLYEQYIIHNKTATQIANELNICDTTVGKYLKKHEIEIKQHFSVSVKSIKWLESIMEQENIYIQHALNEGEYSIPGTRYKADGYCAETNTIYEFYGDYWHGNPNVYNADVYNNDTKNTMVELFNKTIIRENIIKKIGYNLITIWESDFYE